MEDRETGEKGRVFAWMLLDIVATVLELECVSRCL